MTTPRLRAIFNKTQGHCHFCGDEIILENRGWTEGNLTGYWEVDHVNQRGKGGKASTENCLPACTHCNRLRWHRRGDEIRNLISLGLIAQDEIKKKTQLGQTLEGKQAKRLEENQKRRKTKSKMV